MSEAAGELRPVTDYVKLPKDGEPYLEGHKCKNCGTIFMGARNVCSKCFARNEIEAVKLPSKGTLYSYTIVYRSFPGVEVPFVSAVVDIEGGGTVKGNLINVEPDPAKIEMGMNVDVIFKDAGCTDKKGNHYISYFFQPAA